MQLDKSVFICQLKTVLLFVNSDSGPENKPTIYQSDLLHLSPTEFKVRLKTFPERQQPHVPPVELRFPRTERKTQINSEHRM